MKRRPKVQKAKRVRRLLGRLPRVPRGGPHRVKRVPDRRRVKQMLRREAREANSV